jgi:hypothetical protein
MVWCVILLLNLLLVCVIRLPAQVVQALTTAAAVTAAEIAVPAAVPAAAVTVARTYYAGRVARPYLLLILLQFVLLCLLLLLLLILLHHLFREAVMRGNLPLTSQQQLL